ncbi:MAG TPA: hypothetical protein EYN91_11650 [Candidatus Melainabacteria bacterium]|jgi:hypothetical protein|nr:hypothetical protein [Candidatus Melainabacteria bacterium]HIN64468.1 hypothetical protein [Candidatus Obscuribacterales bacterium]
MRKHFVMAAVIATIPIAAAYADPTGAGSGLPGGWSAGNAGMAKPMRPPLKATKQDVNHTNVTTSNATTSASTSSATAPSKAIHVKTKDGMKIQTNLK